MSSGTHPLIILFVIALVAIAATPLHAQDEIADGNKPERLEWFRDLRFSLFIHWSLDSQIGSVISHSLVGAERGYIDRFFTELPRTFNPSKCNPGSRL